LVAELIGCAPFDVATCSTGMIGTLLDRSLLEHGIGKAHDALADDGGVDAARAIMTTDTAPKEAAVTGPRAAWTVGGMAKGAGMLAPALATLLVVVTTDASVDADVLDRARRTATATTFDRLDTDGCMSTNDTVVLMASGASGVAASEQEITDAVTTVCANLARQLWHDAEGAHHDIEIEVVGAATEPEAVDVARSVARSNPAKAEVGGPELTGAPVAS